MDYDVVRVVEAREQRDIEAEAPGVRTETLESLETLVRRARTLRPRSLSRRRGTTTRRRSTSS